MTLSEIWWQVLLLALGSYLLGNLNWSVIISKLKKQDVRRMGSGNPGTMNMLRNYGAVIGFLTLVLDIIKGVIPSLIALLVYGNLRQDGFNLGYLIVYIAGFCAVLGHIFPIFLGFKGGKGAATTFGVFFVCEPAVMGIALLVCIVTICVIKCGSFGSFLGMATPAVAAGIDMTNKYVIGGVLQVPVGLYAATVTLIFAMVFITFFAHRKNIYKIFAGTEHETNLWQIIRKVFTKKSKKTTANH